MTLALIALGFVIVLSDTAAFTAKRRPDCHKWHLFYDHKAILLMQAYLSL